MSKPARRRSAMRISFVPRMVFETVCVAVVPLIGACRNPEQQPVGVAHQGFESSGATREADAGSQSDSRAASVAVAIDATTVDAGDDVTGEPHPSQLDFHPPLPPAVAHAAFENIPPPSSAPDAGTNRRSRRR